MIAPLLLVLGAPPAGAVPGGYLHVLLKGYWICESGGDATTPPKPVTEDSFRIVPDSSYRSNDGQTGSYLLLGNALVMTGGPLRGRRYTLVGQGILHPLNAAGKRTTERCVRQSTGSSMDSNEN